MFKVVVEKECGCFKKSDFVNHQTFSDKDEALITAKNMEHEMNRDWCGKHNFSVIESGNQFFIKVNDAHSGGCCGGGCH